MRGPAKRGVVVVTTSTGTIAQLTTREREIIAAFAEAEAAEDRMSYAEIADRVALSPHTIHFYGKRLRAKLGLPAVKWCRPMIVSEARRLGLVPEIEVVQ